MHGLRPQPTTFARCCAAGLLLAAAAAAAGEPFASRVPMTEHASGNFYVEGLLNGHTATDLLVDTGSGYVSLTRETFDRVRAAGDVERLREIVGALADGSTLRVPIYRIASLTLGADCVLRDVEVAVMAHGSDILGLNALRRLEPFSMRLTPPALSLSGCGRSPAFSRAAEGSERAPSTARLDPADTAAALHARR